MMTIVWWRYDGKVMMIRNKHSSMLIVVNDIGYNFQMREYYQLNMANSYIGLITS